MGEYGIPKYGANPAVDLTGTQQALNRKDSLDPQIAHPYKCLGSYEPMKPAKINEFEGPNPPTAGLDLAFLRGS